VISVVVRARDEAASIGRTLDLLAAQRVPGHEVEVIVVDSGSTDGTVEIARARGVRVIEIARFTFGGALNCGAAAARGEILVALSAHAFPLDDAWLARVAAHFSDPRVACASYGLADPEGRPLEGPFVQDAAIARSAPEWGYSNAAGAFRADLWQRYPFRWDLPGSEDKEWARFWLDRGFVCVIDPALLTDHDHSGDTPGENLERYRREWVGFAMYDDVRPWTVGEALRVWWTEPRGWPTLWHARRSVKRAARIVGEWRGRRFRRPPAPAVAVFTDRWPVLSETFVASEARALKRLGHRVWIEARGHAERPGPAPPDLVAHVHGDESRAGRLAALAWLVARHPRRCLADLRERGRWAPEEAEVTPLRRLAPRARRLRRTLGPLHLHAHFAYEAALDALRLGRLLGVPVSVTAHAADIYLDPRNLRDKLALAHFATSGCAYTVRDLRAIAGEAFAGGVLEVVMGVDGAEFARRAPLPGGRHVVAVGRLVEKKGFVHLVRAAARLGDVQVTIAGEGPERGALEAEIARLGAPVELAGALDPGGVRALLESADLLAMPCVVAADGDRDSMPVVVKEALAMQVCVVASDEVGLPELVREPWGALVPPADDAALAEAIGALLARSPEERAAAGAAGRGFVLEQANVDEEAAKLSTYIRAAQVARAS
jgi:glycosyltransferase involved in cell wall biosynthesis